MEVAYKGRDNRVDLQCLADGRPIDPTSLSSTTVVLVGATTITIDSGTSPSAFDWSRGNGIVSLDLSGVPVGQYSARLILFAPSYPRGLVWDDPIPIVVRQV